MALLDLLRRRRRFTLPAFEPVPLNFEPEADELLLEAIASGLDTDSPVVQLVQPVPTAGELQARIEDHLHGSAAMTRARSAADELRIALAELRQSLG